MNRNIIVTAIAALAFISCVPDIPPKNIVTDDDLLTNQSGMAIYLSRM